MDNELDLDLDDNNEEIISRKDKKIKSLSEKYELSEKEKSELAKARDEAEAKLQALEKDTNFFKGFNQLSSKYQGAGEYQDKIREKVLAGYDIEDATISVLAKEGKLSAQPTSPAERPMVAGGSASNGIHDGADKKPEEYNRDEMKAMLLDMESKGDFRL